MDSIFTRPSCVKQDERGNDLKIGARVRSVNSTEKAIQGNCFHVAVSDMRGGQNNFRTFVSPDVRFTWEN